MKRHFISLVVLGILVAMVASSCGTASFMKRSKIGCPSTRYSIGY